MNALQLLSDYNVYKREVFALQRRPTGKLSRPTPKIVALLDEVLSWCQEQGIEPRLWIYHLFRARRWTFPPALDRKNLLSVRQVQAYWKMQKLDLFRQKILDEGVSSDVTYDPNRDLSTTTEAIKRRYMDQGSLDRCMSEMETTTLGYHPRSKVCMECPLSQACEEKLQVFVGFDIVALRDGRISVRQAQIQAVVK